MSLKNIILKSMAMTMAVSIVFGNVAICGVGIREVIAEDKAAPEIGIELENSKYVQYRKEESTSVAVHSKLNIYANQSKENYMPTKMVEVEVQLPSVNGYLPEKAIVAEARTKSTTGEDLNTNINQKYDSNSGLLTMSYENIPNKDKQIYSEFKEQAKDEIEMIYSYPAEAYTGNQIETKLVYQVNAKMTFKTDKDQIASQGSKKVEITEKENKKDILTFDIAKLENDIYKGFLYSNVQNKTKYNTEFKTVSALCVLNSNLTNELTMEVKESEFELGDKQVLATDGKMNYQSTTISKYEFDRMLGQDGELEIYQGEEVFATVKYVENQKEKKLVVIYLDGTIKELENDKIIIEYSEDFSNLKIRTSKPITEGYIHFENKNVIKPLTDYGCNVQEIKNIKTTSIVNELEYTTYIPMLEPTTKMAVTLSNKNFSTLQSSKTTLTIKLDDTNASAKLFDNPTIIVKLPEGLIGGRLSSPEIVNGNGLKIKNATAKNNVITIELSGKQTAYDLKNVSEGVSIVMDIEDISFSDTLPTHTDKVEVICNQKKEQIVETCDVNIVSKPGLLMLSTLNNYNEKNEVVSTIDNNVKTVEIESNAEAREAMHTLKLVNNYDEKITNVQIIGRIGANNSTFDVQLAKAIDVSEKNAKVYYSTDKDAKANDNSWTEEFSKEAKACKIVIPNNELAKGSNITIKEFIQIPTHVGNNQVSYLNWNLSYTYNGRNTTDTTTMRMATEKKELALYSSKTTQNITTADGKIVPVSLSITPSVTQNYVHSGQMVTYKIKVTNNGQEELRNLSLTDIIPDNAIYTQKKEIEKYDEMSYDIVKDNENKNVIWNIEKLEPNQTLEFEIMLTMAEVSEEQKIINTIKLSYQEQIISEKSELLLKQAKILTTLTTPSDEVLVPVDGIIYDVDDIIEYHINVTNITNNTLKNIKVQYDTPDYLEYVNGGIGLYDEFDGYSIQEQGTINEEVFTYEIPELKASEKKTVVIKYKVKKLVGISEAEINGIGNVEIDGDQYQTNIKTVSTSQSVFTIGLTSNINEDEVLEVGDRVEYIIHVKNIGKRSGLVTVSDTIPEEIEINKIECQKGNEEPTILVTSNSNVEILQQLDAGEEVIIRIIGEVASKNVDKTTEFNVTNKATLLEENLTSNEISFKVKVVVEDNKDDNPDEPNNPDNPEKPDNPEGPNEPENPESPENPDSSEKTYTISGVAWVDENKNGQRDENEKLQDSVIVSLIDKTTGNFALDENGNKITATTNVNGEYKFENIKEGTYIVLFEFDTNTYTVTTYQKNNIEESINSDAILSTVIINGEQKVVGITDSILLNTVTENVDIGLITNATFDLSLNKQITKIIVTNSQGTETYEYEDGDTAKVDLVAKYMNTAKVIVTYKFTVKNEGEVTGYVNSLVDNLPSGLEFNSELNKDWYKGSDGKLYTTTLTGKAIKPGEASEIELVLTKNMTEENTGTFVNHAELEKISNLENIQEKEEALENNESSAILIISIKTGSVVLYTGITLLSIGILAVGIYFIKKKVLNRGI